MSSSSDFVFTLRKFQMNKIENLESIYTFWNYLIEGVSNTISGKKEESLNLNSQK